MSQAKPSQVKPNDVHALVPVFGNLYYRWDNKCLGRALRLALGYHKTVEFTREVIMLLGVTDMRAVGKYALQRAEELEEIYERDYASDKTLGCEE